MGFKQGALKLNISTTKYFDQRLLNYTQKFSSDSDYLFFAHSVIQKLNLSSQIIIAMRKVATKKLRTGMLASDFSEKINDFISSNNAFTLMNGIKGAPYNKTVIVYWNKVFI